MATISFLDETFTSVDQLINFAHQIMGEWRRQAYCRTNVLLYMCQYYLNLGSNKSCHTQDHKCFIGCGYYVGSLNHRPRLISLIKKYISTYEAFCSSSARQFTNDWWGTIIFFYCVSGVCKIVKMWTSEIKSIYTSFQKQIACESSISIVSIGCLLFQSRDKELRMIILKRIFELG